ncbi:hypothetical protein [Propionivibrio limicola]|uniref:hypothetical protein n=1 Tax=Propionivibrio limicola TaxID=167645 RepID=UPI0012928357|nr:hypothetical protein [Propionivibrio limicola]
MKPRTIFILTFGITALLVACVVGPWAVGEFSLRLLVLVFVATASTLVFARIAAMFALSSIGWQLFFGAVIAVLSLLIVCSLQYYLASECNPATRYDGDPLISKACIDQEIAFGGFLLASPAFAVLGAAIAVVATMLAKRSPYSTGTAPSNKTDR